MFLLALLLPLAACLRDETISAHVTPEETFRLVSLEGAPVEPRVTIAFPARGQVVGEGPCNRYRARQTAPMPWFEIGAIAVTRRSCPELALEARYLSALGEMTLEERFADVLLLSDDAGRTLEYRLEE